MLVGVFEQNKKEIKKKALECWDCATDIHYFNESYNALISAFYVKFILFNSTHLHRIPNLSCKDYS